MESQVVPGGPTGDPQLSSEHRGSPKRRPVKRRRESSSSTTSSASSSGSDEESERPVRPRLRRKASQLSLSVPDRIEQWDDDEKDEDGGDSDDDSEYEESEDDSADEGGHHVAKNLQGKRKYRTSPPASRSSVSSAGNYGGQSITTSRSRLPEASSAIALALPPPPPPQQQQQQQTALQAKDVSSASNRGKSAGSGDGRYNLGSTEAQTQAAQQTAAACKVEQDPPPPQQKQPPPRKMKARGGATWVGSTNAIVSIVKKKSLHQCGECGKVFAKPCKLSRHVTTHTGEKSFMCKEEGCGKAFATKDKLTRHGFSHARKLLTAMKPPTAAASSGPKAARAPATTHGGDESNASPPSSGAAGPAAGKGTGEEGQTKGHAKVIVGDGDCKVLDTTLMLKHACVGCGKSFLDNYHLKRHVKARHEGPRPFKCDHPVARKEEKGRRGSGEGDGNVCGAAFAKKWQLREHLSNEHGGVKSNSRLCRCTHPECGRAFDRPSKLAAHEKTHVPRFFCEFEGCGKGFVLASGLNLHLREEHPFRCSVCDLCFDREDKMQEHQSTHARAGDGGLVRPYLCCVPGCGKAFTEKRNLNVHRRTAHTEGGRKRFHCEEPGCDFAFAHRHTLVKHVKREHGSPLKKQRKARTASAGLTDVTAKSSGSAASDGIASPNPASPPARDAMASWGATTKGVAVSDQAAATASTRQGAGPHGVSTAFASTASASAHSKIIDTLSGQRLRLGVAFPRSRSAAELSSPAPMAAAEPSEAKGAAATARAENRGDVGGKFGLAAAVVDAREVSHVRSELDGSSAVTQASNAVPAAESCAEKASRSPQGETREVVGGDSKEGNGNERAAATAVGKVTSETDKQAWASDLLKRKTRLVKNFAGNSGGGSGGFSSAAAVRRPRSNSL